MQKECKICGALFYSDNLRRIYCNDCSSHTTSRQREYKRAYRESYRRMYEPSVIECKCYECGKEFKTISKLLFSVWDGAERIPFCSKRCKDKYKQDHAVCACCGKTMSGNPRYNPDNTHDQYCSAECEEKARYENALKNGWVRTCKNCGKEFVRKDGLFCSQGCYKEAVKKGWRPEKKEASSTVQVSRSCVVCGKEVFQTIAKEDLLHETFKRKHYTCSDRCRRVLEAAGKARKAKEEETSGSSCKERSVPLCTDCKVSYSKCDLMKTNFRVKPKGAKYNGQGQIIECPLYKK